MQVPDAKYNCRVINVPIDSPAIHRAVAATLRTRLTLNVGGVRVC